MLSLTKHEKCILIFLIFTAFLGVGLNFYKKTSYPISIRAAYNKRSITRDRIEKPLIVNINSATQKELITLKGVGPVLADRIIEYRRKHGYFSQREDLQKVKGIGAAKFEDVKEMISVK